MQKKNISPIFCCLCRCPCSWTIVSKLKSWISKWMSSVYIPCYCALLRTLIIRGPTHLLVRMRKYRIFIQIFHLGWIPGWLVGNGKRNDFHTQIIKIFYCVKFKLYVRNIGISWLGMGKDVVGQCTPNYSDEWRYFWLIISFPISGL